MKSQDQDLTLAPLEEDVLTVVLGRELYGLQIIRGFEEVSEGKRKIGFGSLYPTLHKLEKKGFVESRWGDERPEERSGARRRYYRVTGLGEQALRETSKFRANLASWQPVLGRV